MPAHHPAPVLWRRRRAIDTLVFTSLFVSVLYLFSLLAQFSLLGILFSDTFSGLLKLTLILRLPYSVLTDTSVPLFLVLVLNSTLTALFIFQIIKRIRTIRLRHLQYGLPASILSVLSIGCVACGALVTPSLFLFASGIPLFASFPTNTALGIAASALLLLGNYLIYHYQKSLS